MPLGPLVGHLWTVRPFLGHAARPPRAPAHEPFRVDVADARHGAVPVRGRLSRQGATTCVILVHGLGGDVDSGYLVELAAAMFRQGHDVLRLGLRGSDASGDDVYHAGLGSDVDAALRSPALAGYRTLWLVGFSLGGHVALRTATADHDPRLKAAVAIGSPLDLARSSHAIDAPARWPYRQHVVRSLRSLGEVLHRRGRLPGSIEELRRVRAVRDWDRAVIVPRFGFDGVEGYYAAESAAPRLRALALPSLYVGARHDPMVPEDSVRPALAGASSALDVRWTTDGGHVGFPPRLDLGVRGERGLAGQVSGWLEEHGG
jgi:predicted alpha/beta-fold hydrolase